MGKAGPEGYPVSSWPSTEQFPVGGWPRKVRLIWEGERTAHLRKQSVGRNSTSSHGNIHPTPTALPPKPDHPAGSVDGTKGPGPSGVLKE